jgi:uncharacterized membrane protein YfcA
MDFLTSSLNDLFPGPLGQIGWVFLVVLAAGGVHGLLGIGFPMIATPLIAMLTDVRSAMLLVLLPTLAINIVNVIAGGRWRDSLARFWPLAVYSILGSILGTRLIVVGDPAPYKLLLAAGILAYLYISRYGVRLGWVKTRPHLAVFIFGFSGGILAGTVNVMLPALIILGLELRLSRRVMVQTFNFCFFWGKLAQAAVFMGAGVLSFGGLTATVPITLAALMALWAGMRGRPYINADSYRRGLKIALGLLALLLIVQFLYDPN